MNGDGGIPWNVLLFLPVQALALAVGIGVAALLLGKDWDQVHARPPQLRGWALRPCPCGRRFASWTRRTTRCPTCQLPAQPAREGPRP